VANVDGTEDEMRITCSGCDKQFGSIKNMKQNHVSGQIYCSDCWDKIK